MKKYGEAERIQAQADTLEEVERFNNERQVLFLELSTEIN